MEQARNFVIGGLKGYERLLSLSRDRENPRWKPLHMAAKSGKHDAPSINKGVPNHRGGKDRDGMSKKKRGLNRKKSHWED